jgi:hypothetical protein
VAQTEEQGDEAGASLDMRGVIAIFAAFSSRFLDIFLTFGEMALGEYQAGCLTFTQEASRKSGGGVRNSAAADFDKALCGDTSAVRSTYVCCDQQRARRENLAIQIVLTFHRFFFIGAIQVVSKPTP